MRRKSALFRHLDGRLVFHIMLNTQAFQLVAHNRKIIGRPYTLRCQVIKDAPFVRGSFSLRIGYCRFFDAFFTQLVFYIKLADTLYLVAEEVQTVRDVMAETVNIHYAPADSVLAGLEHKIHTFEAQLRHTAAQLRLLDLLTRLERHAALNQFLLTRSTFCHCLRICDHYLYSS